MSRLACSLSLSFVSLHLVLRFFSSLLLFASLFPFSLSCLVRESADLRARVLYGWRWDVGPLLCLRRGSVYVVLRVLWSMKKMRPEASYLCSHPCGNGGPPGGGGMDMAHGDTHVERDGEKGECRRGKGAGRRKRMRPRGTCHGQIGFTCAFWDGIIERTIIHISLSHHCITVATGASERRGSRPPSFALPLSSSTPVDSPASRNAAAAVVELFRCHPATPWWRRLSTAFFSL